MGILGNDEFLTRLAELFASRKGKDHGAIYLTQKRLNAERQTTNLASPVGDDSLGDPNQDLPLPVLIRATNGKSKEKRAEKLKLSTRVDANALESFYSRYAEICKAGMTTLKPRDRSKRKAKAKKRRGGPSTGA